MAARRTQPTRPPAPPSPAEEGEARVRALLVPLFDRKDGTGADWRLMLESLYRAGFQIADGWPDGEGRRSLMRRVHEGSYKRMTEEAGTHKTDAAGPDLAPPNTGALKLITPKPPK